MKASGFRVKMDPIAKTFVLVGFLLIVSGVLWQLGWLQELKLGRLPGDIAIERENFHFYFPFTTGILLSLFVQALFKLYSWLSGG